MKYWKLTESNTWEGETWYHYFEDHPGVSSLLQTLLDRSDVDFDSLEEIELTDEEATILVNLESGYIDTHFFGVLDLEKASHASDQELYKGGIRNFAKDLFELVSPIEE